MGVLKYSDGKIIHIYTRMHILEYINHSGITSKSEAKQEKRQRIGKRQK